MRISQALILALGVYCGRLVAEICPPDWQRYGESCYFIIKDKMDWYQANRTCAESRANLAIPNSKSKHDYMWELFLKEPDMTSTDHWIGCNDIEEEGNWQHCPLPGDINAYENWAEKEPNDNKGGEDCGAQVNKYNGQWDDRKCDTLFFANASSRFAVVAASILSACYTTPWRSSWVKASDHAGRLADHIPDVTVSICLSKLEGRWFVHKAARVRRNGGQRNITIKTLMK